MVPRPFTRPGPWIRPCPNRRPPLRSRKFVPNKPSTTTHQTLLIGRHAKGYCPSRGPPERPPKTGPPFGQGGPLNERKALPSANFSSLPQCLFWHHHSLDLNRVMPLSLWSHFFSRMSGIMFSIPNFRSEWWSPRTASPPPRSPTAMPVWTAPTTVAAAGALALLLAYATVLPPGPTASASIVPTAALPVARTTAHRSGPPPPPRPPPPVARPRNGRQGGGATPIPSAGWHAAFPVRRIVWQPFHRGKQWRSGGRAGGQLSRGRPSQLRRRTPQGLPQRHRPAGAPPDRYGWMTPLVAMSNPEVHVVYSAPSSSPSRRHLFPQQRCGPSYGSIFFVCWQSYYIGAPQRVGGGGVVWALSEATTLPGGRLYLIDSCPPRPAD